MVLIFRPKQTFFFSTSKIKNKTKQICHCFIFPIQCDKFMFLKSAHFCFSCYLRKLWNISTFLFDKEWEVTSNLVEEIKTPIPLLDINFFIFQRYIRWGMILKINWEEYMIFIKYKVISKLICNYFILLPV